MPLNFPIRIQLSRLRFHIRPLKKLIKKQSAIRVDVKDEGIGVPINELEAIFDQFAQSSKTNTGAGGTGLGLAICKEIIEGHHGIIKANSIFGQGTTISFSIPLQNKTEILETDEPTDFQAQI